MSTHEQKELKIRELKKKKKTTIQIIKKLDKIKIFFSNILHKTIFDR